MRSRRPFVSCAVLILFLSLHLSAQTPAPGGATRNESAVQVAKKARVRLGGVIVGAGYTHYSGGYGYGYLPGWYGCPWYYSGILYDRCAFGPYAPFFYSPLLMGFERRAGMGEIRLKTDVSGASVFLDGAFAGSAKDLKNIWLDPGAYNLSVEAEGYRPFTARVYVLSQRTLKIHARLVPGPGVPKP